MAFLVSHVSHRERVAAGLEKTNTLRMVHQPIWSLRFPLLTYVHPNLPTIVYLVMLLLQDGVADTKEDLDEGVLKEEKSTCQKRYFELCCCFKSFECQRGLDKE